MKHSTKQFNYALLGALLLLQGCGSTDKPEAEQTEAGDYVVSGLSENSGVFKVSEGASFGTGVSRNSLYRSPDAESNLRFQLKLTEVGEERAAVLYVNTDDGMNAGYGVQISLDSHDPGEVNVVASVLVGGVEQGGHFHLFENIETPVTLNLSIDSHPAEPHLIIMDHSGGAPTQNIVFDSEESIRSLQKARLGQKLGFRLGRGAELSTPALGEALVEE